MCTCGSGTHPAGPRGHRITGVHRGLRRVRLTDLDGAPATYLPAVYCRHCNRSGWAVHLGLYWLELDSDDTTIRRRKQRSDDRFRALVHAPAEASAYDAALEPDPQAASRLAWLIVPERRISLNFPPKRIGKRAMPCRC